MRVAIVMTYYQRQFQLNRTLLSIAKSEHKDFEVIVVDDSSPDDIVLPDLPYEVTKLKTYRKTWTNPEPAYNIGIYFALLRKAEIVILQNAECYHNGDILSYAQRVTPESYISFGCYSIDHATTFGEYDINQVIEANNTTALTDGVNAWYNHPVLRPVGYDFCSAITAENIKRLNGYDERFSDGCAYGDDYLIARIKMMGLQVEITETPFVVHQWHYSNPGLANHAELCYKNSLLLQELTQLNEIRAEHRYTHDL